MPYKPGLRRRGSEEIESETAEAGGAFLQQPRIAFPGYGSLRGPKRLDFGGARKAKKLVLPEGKVGALEVKGESAGASSFNRKQTPLK